MAVVSYGRISRFFFCDIDLDLDPMTLTYEDILNMYLRTKKEVSRSKLSKVRARTGQTDTQTDASKRITRATFAGDNNSVHVVCCIIVYWFELIEMFYPVYDDIKHVKTSDNDM